MTIFAIYTPWETLEKFRVTLPHFPLLARQASNFEKYVGPTKDIIKDIQLYF